MNFKLAFTFVLLCGTQFNVSAEESCSEKSGNVQVEGLSDLLQATKSSWPEVSTDFCYNRRACFFYSEFGDTSTKPKPEEFFCEEHSLYERISVEEVWKRPCNLTHEERIVINDYSYGYYSCMNDYLRQKEFKSPQLDSYIQKLTSALDKLPSYEGIVVRGATLPPEIAKLHAKGKTVSYDAFTSASTKSIPWGTDRFIIFSKTGKPIMSLANISKEYEVLFKAGTEFKVLDQYSDGGTNYYIMKEVIPGEDNDKVDLSLIEKMKTIKETEQTPDQWACPEISEDIPSRIQQKSVPSYKVAPKSK